MRTVALFAFAVGAALVACDVESDQLEGGGLGSRTRTSSKSGTSTDQDSTDPASDAQKAADAKAMFVALAPKLTSSCGPCHTTGASSAPIWLGAGADQYTTIKAYKGIVVADPSTSLLITKGTHEAAGLSDAMKPDVTSWLQAEAAAVVAAPTTGADTTAVAIPSGAGSVDLPAPGGTITFTASMGSGILTLKSVALVAPPSSGIHATGVHIHLVHADGSTKTDESLAASDTNIAKGASAPIGVGLVVIPQVATDDEISFSIDTLVVSDGGATTTVGGCKNVASFQANAVPAIKNNTCMSCHDTGGSGNGALDLSALALATPDIAKACGQAKSKIDTANIAQSPIITAPTGGVAAHPFKTAPASYRTAMTTWITAEK